MERLVDAARPALALWGLQQVNHPTRNVSLWVPLGLGLTSNRTREGLEFRDPQRRVSLDYKYFTGVNVQGGYPVLLETVQRQGAVIQYKVLRRDFFVIMSYKDNVSTYSRYHNDDNGALGFSFSWNNDNGPVYGERLVTLISSSLYAEATGGPWVSPPSYSQEVAAVPPSTRPAPTPIAPAPKTEEEDKLSSGTGYFVTNSGHIVTNHHVVKSCSTIAVFSGDQPAAEGRLIGSDETNDLAVLKTDLKPTKVANIRIGARLGDPIAVFGYPLSQVLASSGNFTLGSITALAGMRDDTRHLQISAPVQAGNSGGPLLDASGNLVGTIISKLNAMKVVQATGDMPQNVNFAIKSSVVASFLESRGISYETNATSNALAPADLADHAKALSVMILCK
ncbi:serine protease [Microvirga aerilata]|uniref:Serine protease n=2 Tax=Microvirga aerilata TaxID=670292 RepID=A0A936ZA35_9HYPH|nr:S1C family serine protease [Microvirga aerilata]MBL0403795.1 serine protease [Microvirga aerilata]